MASDSESIWCGLTRFTAGLELQDWALKKVQRAESRAVLLGLEHEPVITMGRKALDADVLDLPEGFEVCRVSRGGQATLHEPGQLVVYPIVPVYQVSSGVKNFVQRSLEALAKTVRSFGVTCRVDLLDPGVFTANGKIGFIGIQVVHGISQHGLSLNVCNPIQRFNSIRPCGHNHQVMDSLAAHGIDASPKDVFQVFTEHWFDEFGLTNSQNTANPGRPQMVRWRSW